MTSWLTHSQWVEHLVSDGANSANKLVVIDLDNDGFQDIVINQRSQNAVFWYKNDGAGNFSAPLLIAQNLPSLRGLAVGDLTGNGFKDIVVSSHPLTSDQNLRWIEHLDGNGTFGNPQTIPENPTTMSQTIVLGDMDGDGLLDIVVSASAASDRSITWYRNQGSGVFSSPNVVITSFSNALGIAVGDIDGDGDLDIVSGTSNTGVTSWFENLDGQGGFGAPIPIGTVGMYNILRLHLVDIDGDGDLDLVGSGSSIYAWWENLDGQGTFSSERFITSDEFITANYPADIDNDGDIDLFALSLDPDAPPVSTGFMYWYENVDGLGNFSPPHTISDNLINAVTIEAADLNGDGSIDPVSVSQTFGTIFWFENPLLSIDDNEISTLIVYPNPVKDSLKIDTEKSIESLFIYNNNGQLVFNEKWETGKTAIDVTLLSPGLYLLELRSNEGTEKIRFLKE